MITRPSGVRMRSRTSGQSLRHRRSTQRISGADVAAVKKFLSSWNHGFFPPCARCVEQETRFRMFKIGAAEQTRHAPAQSSPAQINANAFVLRIAHRVVTETMRDASTGLRR